MFLYINRMVFWALVVVMFSACSNSEEQADKGHIGHTTDKIAQEAIRNIKTPIDKATVAKELTEQHNNAVKENINQ